MQPLPKSAIEQQEADEQELRWPSQRGQDIEQGRTINCMESMKEWAMQRGLKVR